MRHPTGAGHNKITRNVVLIETTPNEIQHKPLSKQQNDCQQNDISKKKLKSMEINLHRNNAGKNV